MKRRLWTSIGILLVVVTIAATSVAAYEYFRPRIRSLPWVAALEPAQGSRVPPGQTVRSSAVNSPGVDTGRVPDMREGLRSGAVLSLVQALDIATGHVPGEVLKVELKDKRGRRLYEIKVLAGNGRVREIKLDAHTGMLLEIEDD